MKKELEVFVATYTVATGDPWESEDAGEIRLLGIFYNRQQLEAAISAEFKQEYKNETTEHMMERLGIRVRKVEVGSLIDGDRGEVIGSWETYTWDDDDWDD